MGGVVFVVGQEFPHHWQAALESGFWESERHVEVKPGDTLIFWQAGDRRLLGLGEATASTEPADYRVQERPWDRRDPTDYHFRYRFEPTPMRAPTGLTWARMMELLGQNPRRGANTAPIRFERSSDDIAVRIEDAGGVAVSPVAVEISHRHWHGREPRGTRRAAIGGDYVDADESVLTREGVVFKRDPQQVDRGLRAHAMTQNMLANWLRERAIVPLRAGSVNFDLAWEVDGGLYVAEIKSLHEVNERNQIRLGMGEVIDFAYRLGGARKVLAVEREPHESRWTEVCAFAGIRLVWPGAFERLIPW